MSYADSQIMLPSFLFLQYQPTPTQTDTTLILKKKFTTTIKTLDFIRTTCIRLYSPCRTAQSTPVHSCTEIHHHGSRNMYHYCDRDCRHSCLQAQYSFYPSTLRGNYRSSAHQRCNIVLDFGMGGDFCRNL